MQRRAFYGYRRKEREGGRLTPWLFLKALKNKHGNGPAGPTFCVLLWNYGGYRSWSWSLSAISWGLCATRGCT